MGIISLSLPADGTTGDVADVNTPFTTIATEINGQLDNTNIKSAAAIDGSKLADNTITYSKLVDGTLVQEVAATFSAVATGTTIVPADDTIPQNTEGTEFMTLAITPKSLTNRLEICVIVVVANSAVTTACVAIFQDTTANALAAAAASIGGAGYSLSIPVTHSMTAGTIASTTFKVRIGPSGASTLTFNGVTGARLYGAITKSSIVIREYKA